MKKNILMLLMLIIGLNTYGQSISFFDLTNLSNLSSGEAHNYLTLGKVFKHQYLEKIDGKKLEHFKSVDPKEKEQTVTIGVNNVLNNGIVLHTITYTTLDTKHIVNMISQAKRAKLIMKFQGVDRDNNVYLFDNDFYSVAMYISTTENRGLVKINQKEFIGY